jgi:hypothetical protein
LRWKTAIIAACASAAVGGAVEQAIGGILRRVDIMSQEIKHNLKELQLKLETLRGYL